ncbi:FHA domain-containing protein [Catenovulum sp. 2E275]|uniref:FHA domain-containing protein n=1 Tax=Catenovulum sp. 2E275 TaxID=2980497 RepID=UPI0021D07DC0|nr:FHA domain-containing protein [Catenovulum sp. 2E275]MCU4676407.1 FHA domain-containing protein [Catenovulum sp. 2E275]
MELIIQVLSRSGKVDAQHKINANQINIGRAYDNQVILEDIHVSEHHARLSFNEAGEIQIEDLNSLNHLYDHNKNQLEGKTLINSGDEFYLGKLRLKILTPDHPVASTIALTKSEATAELFSSKRLNILLVAALLGLFGLQQYLTFFGEFQLKQLFTPLIGLVVALSIWPIFWSLLSRFFKHEARFWAHCATLILTLLCSELITGLSTFIGYNTSADLGLGIQLAAEFIIVFACFRFSLYLFNQKMDSRQLWLSFSLTCFLFSLVGLSYYAKNRDFSAVPAYSGTILPNQFLFKQSESIDTFVQNNQSLYAKAQLEAVKDQTDSDSDDETTSDLTE